MSTTVNISRFGRIASGAIELQTDSGTVIEWPDVDALRDYIARPNEDYALQRALEALLEDDADVSLVRTRVRVVVTEPSVIVTQETVS